MESKEHLLNDEEYVVVDFVGHVEVTSSSRKSSVSSRKSSQVEAPLPPAVKLLDDEEGGEDSLPESAIDLTPPSMSPISNSPTFDEINDRQLLVDDAEKEEPVIDTKEPNIDDV